MANFTGNVNFEGKTTNPRTTTALTAAATVNLDFSNPKAWTLNLNQITTINITGTYVNDDIVFIRVTGDFLLKFVQATFTFEGTFLRQSDGVITNYVGGKTNNIAVRCIDSTNKIFEVICNPNY